MKAMLMSIVPAAKPAYEFTESSTYWTLVNPSLRSSSSATYCGAMQMPGIFASRMVVISGGASCANPFAPISGQAAAVPPTSLMNSRRLMGLPQPDGHSLPHSVECSRCAFISGAFHLLLFAQRKTQRCDNVGG